MKLFLFLVLLLNVEVFSGLMAQSPIHDAETIFHPVVGEKGMVATQHHAATKVGLEILEKGGNAIDAAVGVGFALAVVLPRAGNLGGGGFLLYHDAKQGKNTSINYREMAPAGAYENMYLDEDDNVDNQLFNQSHLSVGVPGTVAGLLYALEKYGTMEIEEVITPAIKLAKDGFTVSYDLARILRTYESRMRKWPETEKIFYKGENAYYEAGDILRQEDLAWTLTQIKKHGLKGFYEVVGKKIAAEMQANGGLITTEDLKNYKVSEVEPVEGSYRGYEIISMPPPSSGGVHLIQMLNILEAFPMAWTGHNSAESIHLLAETMKLAYADRSKHLGDPAFWNVPVAGILSKEYADDLRKKVNRYYATPSSEINPGQPQDYESEETTHFSVVDQWGNAVSNTYTLNFSFGTGIVAKGTGVLLNNEMGDFSAKPGTPNAFGLLGGKANAVEPGKRPLSSMTPSMVLKDGKPYLITGSPGGSRIITTVLQVIMNVIDHGMNIAEASNVIRVHHQWYPDILFYERGLNHDTKRILISKGHRIQERPVMGSTQSIMIKNGFIYGASDPRRPDALTLGY